jgi:hypothetical protein
MDFLLGNSTKNLCVCIWECPLLIVDIPILKHLFTDFGEIIYENNATETSISIMAIFKFLPLIIPIWQLCEPISRELN